MRVRFHVAESLAILAFGCQTRTVPGSPAPPQRALPGLDAAIAAVAPDEQGVPYPVVRRANYVIAFGHHSVEIDPVDGGRIVAFSFDGRNVLASHESSPEAYGSSFWTSPQSDWDWPPPRALDKDEWKAAVEGATLVLESETDCKLGLSARQRMTADVRHDALAIEFTLTNRGATPRSVAPWQNTRVRPNGLTFYPSSQGWLPPSTLKLEPFDGIVWLGHVASQVKESAKFFGDGSEGWIAHVDGDLVFVKVFPDVPRHAQAPREAEIEIYVHGSGRFVEVEQQGPYVELAPGASCTWTVQWLLRKLPPDVNAEPRSTELVGYVREMVAKLR